MKEGKNIIHNNCKTRRTIALLKPKIINIIQETTKPRVLLKYLKQDYLIYNGY